MQQPRPWKLKKEKTPIADQLWVLESRNGAAAKALAFHECSLGSIPDSKSPLHWACWFCTPRSERAFFFFKGFRFFRLLEQSDIVIIIEILEACTYKRKRKVFIIIAITTFD